METNVISFRFIDGPLVSFLDVLPEALLMLAVWKLVKFANARLLLFWFFCASVVLTHSTQIYLFLFENQSATNYIATSKLMGLLQTSWYIWFTMASRLFEPIALLIIVYNLKSSWKNSNTMGVV
jgi:hypothetical protein